MEIKEAVAFLDDLMLKHDFPLSARTDCFYKNESKINTMQDIFNLKTPEDFTYLFALSNLLSDTPDAVNDYFLGENKDCSFVDNLRKPNRKDLLLVATAMEENPKFFSMARTWVTIVEMELAQKSNSTSELKSTFQTTDTDSKVLKQNNIISLFKTDSDLFHPQSIEVDYPIYASAAGSSGFNNLTQMPINFPFLGELEVRGNSETERLVFVLFIAPGCREMKFKLNIYYEIDNKEYTATITKESNESTDEIRSRPIRINFSKGIHIKKTEWEPL